MDRKAWRAELKNKIKDQVDDAVSNANIAAAVNIGRSGTCTSVSSRQRVVQRDGETLVEEERVERKSS